MNPDYRADICIVGMGPAGIGAALTLSEVNPGLKVLCIDAGESINERNCPISEDYICKKKEHCDVISGIGGASLFGGHKISLLPAGSNLCEIIGSKGLAEQKLNQSIQIIKQYISLEKPIVSEKEILDGRKIFEGKGFQFRYYDSCLCTPTALRELYRQTLLKLNSRGFTVLTDHKAVTVNLIGNQYELLMENKGRMFKVKCKYLIISAGRSGHNFLKHLNEKLRLGGLENCLDVGVRLEFPTEVFSDIDKYHFDLKLLWNNLRTFCVCKNGTIVPYHLDDLVILDGGYDKDNQTKSTNLGIILRTSNPKNRTLSEIKERIIQLSDGKPMSQPLTDYLELKKEKSECVPQKSSIYVDANINECFPKSISKEIREGVKKFVVSNLSESSWDKVTVFAPVIEYSWLKFPVKSDFSVAPGMYVIGDCAGRFRGILQAFCSGVICAEKIIYDINEKK
jgi:hypothetical protein